MSALLIVDEKMFMVDLETTGTVIYPSKGDPKQTPSKILQISILELKRSSIDTLWQPGKSFDWYNYHPMPEKFNPFQEKFQKGLFEKCAQSRGKTDPTEVRLDIKEFFKSCGKEGPKVMICGYNASNFDMPLLTRDGFLYSPYTDNDTDEVRGDFHYRIYELGGAVAYRLNKDKIHDDRRRDFLDKATEAGWKQMASQFGVYHDSIKEGRGEHDGLYDCYSQTALLNGLLDC